MGSALTSASSTTSNSGAGPLPTPHQMQTPMQSSPFMGVAQSPAPGVFGTPASAAPFTPSFNELPMTLEIVNWVCVGMQVKVSSSADSNRGRSGVVIHLRNPGEENMACEVDFTLVEPDQSGGDRVEFPLSVLEPVRPGPKDSCVFSAGEFKGQHGQVQTLLLEEAVVTTREGVKVGMLGEMVKLHPAVAAS